MEQISIESARNGEPSATVGSVRIHSAFNPEKEAQRFLQAHLTQIRPKSVVVIIGAGLGYISRELKKNRPDVRIIAIYLHEKLYTSRMTQEYSSMHHWHPGDKRDVESFFFDVLSETSVCGLKILEWPASIKAMPALAEKVINALSTVIRRYSGNITTITIFGKKWISNSFRNYLDLKQIIIPHKSPDPVVLTASGPDLENTLGILDEYRTRFQIWALPSSLPALNKAGIKPHLIIATDPGFWARIHSRYFPDDVPLVMPLSTAPGQNLSDTSLLLSQGTPGEHILLGHNTWPHLNLPAMGTVAATGIELWKRISSGPLLIAGLDLCWYDLRSHARPHSFDGWLASLSSRKNPMHNILWNRARTQAPERLGIHRIGPALSIYRDWFRHNTPAGRVFRLTAGNAEASPISLPCIIDQGFEMIRQLPENIASHILHVMPPPENYRQRKTKIRVLLSHWKHLLDSHQEGTSPECENLLYTLDPGGVLELEQSSHTQYAELMLQHRDRVNATLNDLGSIYG